LKDRKHKGSKRRNKDMQNATNKAKKLKANNQQQKKNNKKIFYKYTVYTI
jgi:hypothetical protein